MKIIENVIKMLCHIFFGMHFENKFEEELLKSSFDGFMTYEYLRIEEELHVLTNFGAPVGRIFGLTKNRKYRGYYACACSECSCDAMEILKIAKEAGLKKVILRGMTKEIDGVMFVSPGQIAQKFGPYRIECF